jgi:hypothetical protein
MATIAEVRQQYPQYADMSDRQLADALHAKFYGDMPKPQFYAKVGLTGQPSAPAKPAVNVGRDMAQSAVTGATQSVRGMNASMQPRGGMDVLAGVVEGGSRLVGNVLSRVGATEVGGAVTGAGKLLAGGITGSTDYRPQTEAGKVALTAGQMAPNILAPGSAGARAANFIVPTATTELAGRTAEALGAGAGGVQAARVAGGIAGGIAANARLPARAPKPATPPPAKAPSLEDLRTAKNAAYAEVDGAGVQYKPEASTRLADTVKTTLADGMVDPDLHPKVTAVARRVEGLRGQPVSLTKIDQIRRVIRDNVFTPTASKDERRLGYQMIDALDDFVASSKADDVLSSGDPGQAASALQRARDLNTRVAKIEAVQGAQLRAKNSTMTAGSGGNIDNNTRREIGKVADRGRNWTPAEAAALERIRKGGTGQNVLRAVGKMSPSGNGLMQAGSLYAAAKTGGASIPASLAAIVSKYVADGMTTRAVDNVMKLIASGKEAQAAQIAARDPKVAGLLRDLRGLNLNSSTVQALVGPSGTPDPRWQAAAQGLSRN